MYLEANFVKKLNLEAEHVSSHLYPHSGAYLIVWIAPAFEKRVQSDSAQLHNLLLIRRRWIATSHLIRYFISLSKTKRFFYFIKTLKVLRFLYWLNFRDSVKSRCSGLQKSKIAFNAIGMSVADVDLQDDDDEDGDDDDDDVQCSTRHGEWWH